MPHYALCTRHKDQVLRCIHSRNERSHDATSYPAKFYRCHPPRRLFFLRDIEVCSYHLPASHFNTYTLSLSLSLSLSSSTDPFLSISHGRSFSSSPASRRPRSSSWNDAQVFEKPAGKLKIQRVATSRWQLCLPSTALTCLFLPRFLSFCLILLPAPWKRDR